MVGVPLLSTLLSVRASPGAQMVYIGAASHAAVTVSLEEKAGPPASSSGWPL